MATNEGSFVAKVELRSRADNYHGKRVHFYKKSESGVGMMVKQDNQVLSNHIGFGDVEVVLPFGISAHFTSLDLYKKRGIQANIWKSQMTEDHAKDMDTFAQNLIDVGNKLKKTSDKIKKTVETKKRKAKTKASKRSSKATKPA